MDDLENLAKPHFMRICCEFENAIYTLYPESFCDKNLAIRKVFTFCDSGHYASPHMLFFYSIKTERKENMFKANAMYGHKDRTIIIQSILWSRRKIVSCNTWSPSNCPMIRDLLDHFQQRHFSRAPILNIYNLGFKWIGTNFVNYSQLHCVSINLRSNSNCQTVPACCKSCKSYQRCSTEVNLIFKKIFQGELDLQNDIPRWTDKIYQDEIDIQ